MLNTKYDKYAKIINSQWVEYAMCNTFNTGPIVTD